VSQTDTNESGSESSQGEISAAPQVDTEGGDTFASTEGEIESVGGGELPIEDHRPIEDYRPSDQNNESRESNVEAWRRLGASILQ